MVAQRGKIHGRKEKREEQEKGEDGKDRKGDQAGRPAYLIGQKVDSGLVLLTAARAHLYDARCANTLSRHWQKHRLLDEGIDQRALASSSDPQEPHVDRLQWGFFNQGKKSVSTTIPKDTLSMKPSTPEENAKNQAPVLGNFCTLLLSKQGGILLPGLGSEWD